MCLGKWINENTNYRQKIEARIAIPKEALRKGSFYVRS